MALLGLLYARFENYLGAAAWKCDSMEMWQHGKSMEMRQHGNVAAWKCGSMEKAWRELTFN